MLVVAGLALTTKNITDYRIPKLHYDNIFLNYLLQVQTSLLDVNYVLENKSALARPYNKISNMHNMLIKQKFWKQS